MKLILLLFFFQTVYLFLWFVQNKLIILKFKKRLTIFVRKFVWTLDGNAINFFK